jgi:hypothetical protein
MHYLLLLEREALPSPLYEPVRVVYRYVYGISLARESMTLMTYRTPLGVVTIPP